MRYNFTYFIFICYHIQTTVRFMLWRKSISFSKR